VQDKNKTLKKRYTITSALPYANGPLHIGHIAGAYLPADIFVRYLKTGEFSSTEDQVISIDNLRSGSYFIQLSLETGQVYHQMFQKVR